MILKWNFPHVNRKNLNKVSSYIVRAGLAQMVVKAAVAVDVINKRAKYR